MELQNNSNPVDANGPGLVSPQGATLATRSHSGAVITCETEQATGVNFAVYAPAATMLYVALFDEQDDEVRLAMHPSIDGVWHLYVAGITEGQRYGFRADGDWAENRTPRFNINKLLLDPYARQVVGDVTWTPEIFDYTLDNKKWQFNEEDSSEFMPRCVVRSSEFDWQGAERPNIPDQRSIILETHLKGFTKQHPEIPQNLRGTYLGMCHPVAIEYLKDLGITAVELLPVTSRCSEERLVGLGLSNYWGYNPLCLMAPESDYAVDDAVVEMKTMVRELHKAGIEVLMDVVFNHTCEGGHGGPSMSLRGLAESDYYLMDNVDGNLSAVNFSACGNSLNFDSEQTLRLTMDALRLWVNEYHIDGFRFDLAPTMGRHHRVYTPQAPFFYAVSQDPILSQVKMIAEPWDMGPEGYQLTGFPAGWQSWNDRYRDSSRRFWREDKHVTAEAAHRISGSEDLFQQFGYHATVNYICSHDGFNINDLVSYDKRHNLANKEDGRDGDEHNHSWNHGVEGPSENALVNAARLRSQQNLLGMLLLSKGTPMFMAGDEFCNSQDGNNNAYCQDSPISWLDWSWLEDAENSNGGKLRAFTRSMIALRKAHHKLFADELGHTVYDFYNRNGHPVTFNDMAHSSTKGMVAVIRCDQHDDTPTLVVMFNPTKKKVQTMMPLPSTEFDARMVLNTANENAFEVMPLGQDNYNVPAHSIVVMECVRR